MVDFLVTCLLRNALFSRSAVIRTFALAFSNCLQPARTRRFPIKLSIKKRIFWSICGRPGFCSHIFPSLCSRPELVDFLLNCLLRNAFFGRSAVMRTFAITFLQFWATNSNSSVSYYTVHSETHLFGRSAVIRILCRQVELVDFLITCAADSSLSISY